MIATREQEYAALMRDALDKPGVREASELHSLILQVNPPTFVPSMLATVVPSTTTNPQRS